MAHYEHRIRFPLNKSHSLIHIVIKCWGWIHHCPTNTPKNNRANIYKNNKPLNFVKSHQTI
jgi:hypothetical protein